MNNLIKLLSIALIYGIPIIIIVIIILLIAIRRSDHNSAKKAKMAGEEFERLTSNSFAEALHCMPFKSLLFSDGKGGTTETDMVFVSDKGLFAIECKERKGTYIQGTLNGEDWVITKRDMDGDYQMGMDNPFHQNNGHVGRMQAELRRAFPGIAERIPIFSIVCINLPVKLTYYGQKMDASEYFGALRREGKAIVVVNELVRNGRVAGLKKFGMEMDTLPPVLNPDEVQQLCRFLAGKQATPEQMARHVEYVKSSHGE